LAKVTAKAMAAVMSNSTAKLGCIFLFSGIIFFDKKTVPARIPEDFFFPVFSGGFFHRNVVLEVVAAFPVFCRCHRIFL
jgi:hypothetical protein